jgi:DNA-binding transcriptional ArsR family regulator
MIQLYQNIRQLRILGHFFDNPDEEFYLRELGRTLKMSPMTVKRGLDVLTAENLILRQERKNQILYRANVDGLAFRHGKVAYNIAWVEKKGLVGYLRGRIPGISSMVLYGSYAKGENDRHSDLDILLISTNRKVERTNIDRKMGVEVSIVNFTSGAWAMGARDNRAFYLDVITEGIVLHGTMPVVE